MPRPRKDPDAEKRPVGRPKKDRHYEDYEAIGAPPIDNPLKMLRWTQSIAAVHLHRIVTGREDKELGKEIRAAIGTIARAAPPDIMLEAQNLLQQDRTAMDNEAGPQLEDLVNAEGEQPRALNCPVTRI